MITLMMSDGRKTAAASFEVNLNWLPLSVENVDKMKSFRPTYLRDIFMSDAVGHFRYYTAAQRGIKGKPKSRGSRLATTRRRTIAKRSF